MLFRRDVFLGYAPTRKLVSWFGAALFTFDDETIANIWVLGDINSLLALLEGNTRRLRVSPAPWDLAPYPRSRVGLRVSED